MPDLEIGCDLICFLLWKFVPVFKFMVGCRAKKLVILSVLLFFSFNNVLVISMINQV